MKNVVFPDNYRQALGRRFVSSPSFHDDYKAFVCKLISNSHLEKVPAVKLCTEPGKFGSLFITVFIIGVVLN